MNSREKARVLARHQLAGVLPGGVACTCGAELAALNPPLDDRAIKGEPLALAVHQLQELDATAARRESGQDCACRGRHEAHRPSVIKAESWSLYAGQRRAICGSCNWRGPWRADDAKAADRDALDHQFEKDCQTSERRSLEADAPDWSASPTPTGPERCTECDGTGTVYLDSDGDECSEADRRAEVACPHCPGPATPTEPTEETPPKCPHGHPTPHDIYNATAHGALKFAGRCSGPTDDRRMG